MTTNEIPTGTTLDTIESLRALEGCKVTLATTYTVRNRQGRKVTRTSRERGTIVRDDRTTAERYTLRKVSAALAINPDGRSVLVSATPAG